MRRVALLLVLTGCYDWDALSSTFDFSGDYTVVVTNGQNGCGFANWTPGQMSGAIPLKITQTMDQVVVEVGGLTGDLLNLVCGSKQLAGTVHQGAIDVSLICPKQSMQMMCMFHYVAHAHATLNGNHITGTIDYTTVTNHSPDCGQLENCRSTQTFTGNR